MESTLFLDFDFEGIMLKPGEKEMPIYLFANSRSVLNALTVK